MQPVSPDTTLKTLEKEACAQFDAGHFKEAIQCYKKLWQATEQAQWKQQIANCYLQRALSFAARGMVKEALVLWGNYSEFKSGPYQAYDQYIVWLILTKNHNKVCDCLQQLSSQQLDKQYADLAVLLGFLMLTESLKYHQFIAKDSALYAHFLLAKSALDAYSQGNPDAAIERLKKIPFRSAFKDFRIVLQAAMEFPESVRQSQLPNVPTHSPYAQALNLIRLAAENVGILYDGLQGYNRKQQDIVASIKGWNKKQHSFFRQLMTHQGNLTDKIKFNLAIKFQLIFEEGAASQFCQNLLVQYPAGKRDFKKAFGFINLAEESRCNALICESKNEFNEAEKYWQQYINGLDKRNADNQLKIALIRRHIAVYQSDPYEKAALLSESVDYDPEDRESYLQILKLYSAQPDTSKDYQDWLNRALEQFPQDVDVLTLAVKTAFSRKAYKKANQYAKKIIKFDPINTYARQILFASHLAHARRLIKSKKYPLVEKELQLADKMKPSKKDLAHIQLIQGMLCFASEDKQQGLRIITEALNSLNTDPINARFQGAMEAMLTGLPISPVIKALPSMAGCLLTEKQLHHLIHQLMQYTEGDNEDQIVKALEKVKQALKKSLQQQDYSENVVLSLCQSLDKLLYYELLRFCSKLAESKWHKPIWTYYRINADSNGNPGACKTSHIHRLENLREQAARENDKQTTILIDKFLDEYYRLHPERDMDFLDGLFGFGGNNEDLPYESFDDPLDVLFEHIPEPVISKIDQEMDRQIRKTSPEKLVGEMVSEGIVNESIFSAMLLNPDLFTALMLVRTANKLKINIDVSYQEVLDEFAVTNSNSSNRFPF